MRWLCVACLQVEASGREIELKTAACVDHDEQAAQEDSISMSSSKNSLEVSSDVDMYDSDSGSADSSSDVDYEPDHEPGMCVHELGARRVANWSCSLQLE